jgi:hypothetical protein
MRLILDPAQMAESLDLWRHTLAARIREDHVRGPGPDRLGALTRLDGTLDAWLDLLRLATPESEADKRDLQAVKATITSFRAWSEQAHLALQIIEQSRSSTAVSVPRTGSVAKRTGTSLLKR